MVMDKKNQVLIIEDEFDIFNLFKMTAELVPGYEIEIITDGEEAIKRLGNEVVPNMVVLDLHLPTIEGDEFLRAARKDARWKNVPIYIITGDAKAAERHRRHPEGADGVYVKGEYSIDDLQLLLEKHIKQ